MGSHTLRISTETYELINALSFTQNRPMGDVVSDAVTEYLAARSGETREFVVNALKTRGAFPAEDQNYESS